MTFGEEQIDRYSRQIILPQIGGRGQKVLLESTVTWFGDRRSLAGIDYLTSAGVGHLNLIGDFSDDLIADLGDLNPDVDAKIVGNSDAAADVIVTAAAATRAAAQTAAFARGAARSVDIPVIELDLDALTVALFQPVAAIDPCAACDPANESATFFGMHSAGRFALESEASCLTALEVVRSLLRLGDFAPGSKLSLTDLRRRSVVRNDNCPICAASRSVA